MGRQVNFFLLPEDLTDLQQAIQMTGDVVFLQDRTPSSQPNQISSLAMAADDFGRVGLGVYATTSAWLAQVKMRFIEQQEYWLIDQLDSPVIEIDRCFYDGRLIRRGRIYFATDLRFRRHLPDQAFVTWGSAVLRRVRKLLVLDRSIHDFAYVSERVRSWVATNQATVEGGALVRGSL